MANAKVTVATAIRKPAAQPSAVQRIVLNTKDPAQFADNYFIQLTADPDAVALRGYLTDALNMKGGKEALEAFGDRLQARIVESLPRRDDVRGGTYELPAEELDRASADMQGYIGILALFADAGSLDGIDERAALSVAIEGLRRVRDLLTDASPVWRSKAPAEVRHD